ncbi:MAG TPA: PilX N-terminal domain-containing pilus assembly protein [Polyangiaceae bacterium]|nr:PilX N-terminal domain-containing pilus assembly protein [Polyangiaceae bacterium]
MKPSLTSVPFGQSLVRLWPNPRSARRRLRRPALSLGLRGLRPRPAGASPEGLRPPPFGRPTPTAPPAPIFATLLGPDLCPDFGQAALAVAERHRHRGERGAAIFIVVMVLTMLTAIGVFAIRASGMAGAASGYDRQNTQNHYVGEYGLLGAVAELSTTRRSAYIGKMNGGNVCVANKGVAGLPCFPLFAKQIEDTVSGNFSGRPLFEQSSADGGAALVPGSLGPAPLTGDFLVEMTDPGQVGLPVAGSDVGGGAVKLRYLQITLTSVGQVRPAGSLACTPANAGIAGNETSRAFVVVGPLP